MDEQWRTLMLPLVILMVFLRYVLTKYCFTPLGVYLGVKHTQSSSFNTMEEAFLRVKNIQLEKVLAAAKRLGANQTLVEAWLRRRRKQEKNFRKFCDYCWVVVLYGAAILCPNGWYHQYFLSFYCSVFISHYVSDGRSNQFWHNLLKIVIVAFSRVVEAQNVALTVVILYDCYDGVVGIPRVIKYDSSDDSF